MRTLFFVIVFFQPLLAKADQPRMTFEHHSQNNRFVLQLMANEDKICNYKYLDSIKWEMNNSYWRVIDSLTKTELYRFDKGYGEWLMMWSVFVSNDGNDCVAINDFPDTVDSSSMGLISLVVVFKQSNELKRYRLKEILCNHKNVTYTVSHFFWVTELRMYDEEKVFEFETKEMTKFRLSFNNDSILLKKKSPLLTPNTIRVYGKIEPTKKDRVFTITVTCVIFGKMPNVEKITFRVNRKQRKYFVLDEYDSYRTLLFTNGKYVESPYPFEQSMFNDCDKSDKY